MPQKKRIASGARSFPGGTTTLHVKNMVCGRCIKVVGDDLKNLGLDVRSISLGEVTVAGEVSAALLSRIRTVFERDGFELIEDRRARTIEQIKLAVLKLVRGSLLEEDSLTRGSKTRFPEYIAGEVGQEYSSLSTLFSSMESMTIEQYVILQKIERAKELLKYGELTLSEISYKLGYSSVQHLSSQFKKVTGMTPTGFRNLVENRRKPLDRIASGNA